MSTPNIVVGDKDSTATRLVAIVLELLNLQLMTATDSTSCSSVYGRWEAAA